MQILGAVRAQGKVIAFDPNLRPGLWSDVTDMTPSIMGGAFVSDIVLPSFEDDAQFFGDADPQATARRYTQAGVSTVVVKNGSDPVFFVHNGVWGEAPVTPVSVVVDTTSAGDSFNSGLFATAGTSLSSTERIRIASLVAGQAVGGKGALVRLDRSLLNITAEPARGET